jgi:phage terminase large subunit-like protein
VKAMKLANPASWITEAYLARQAADPELTDADVLQLHGCVWAEKDTTWIGPDVWMACRVERRLQEGETIVLGFDGSEKRDTTVLAASTLDGFVTPLAVWERPARGGENWRVPRSEVHAAIDFAMEEYDVVELAFDPPGWYSEGDEWTERYGEKVVMFETKQPKRMAPACERFQTGAKEGKVSHNGHEVLARHVGHCVGKETPWGVLITKDHPDSPRKIDAAVASVIAYERAMWHAQERESVVISGRWAY